MKTFSVVILYDQAMPAVLPHLFNIALRLPGIDASRKIVRIYLIATVVAVAQWPIGKELLDRIGNGERIEIDYLRDDPHTIVVPGKFRSSAQR